MMEGALDPSGLRRRLLRCHWESFSVWSKKIILQRQLQFLVVLAFGIDKIPSALSRSDPGLLSRSTVNLF